MRQLDEIIADSLSGEPLPEEEVFFLEQWKATHGAFYARVVEMNQGQPLHARVKAAGKRAFGRVEQQVKHKRRVRLARYVAAAGMALLMGMAVFFLYSSPTRQGSPVPEAQGIVPGSFRAELKLADGRVIELHATPETLIAENSTSEVRNWENTLIYTPKGDVDTIVYNTLIIPAGAEYKLVLSDGTRVFLNSGSELRYPESFSSGKREVFLTGEAYFEVQEEAHRPFTVQVENLSVRVLGTSFNINAYPWKESIATTLEQGSLQVTCGESVYRMRPGNQVIFHKAAGTSELREVETETYTSWRNGYYYFEQMPLGEIMSTLALWYNLHVAYETPGVKEIVFAGRLKRYDDVTYLLKKFEETNEVEFIVNQNNITIRKK